MPESYCIEDQKKPGVTLKLNLAQLNQLTNVLIFISENLAEYNEREDCNCENCDMILLGMAEMVCKAAVHRREEEGQDES